METYSEKEALLKTIILFLLIFTINSKPNYYDTLSVSSGTIKGDLYYNGPQSDDNLLIGITNNALITYKFTTLTRNVYFSNSESVQLTVPSNLNTLVLESDEMLTIYTENGNKALGYFSLTDQTTTHIDDIENDDDNFISLSLVPRTEPMIVLSKSKNNVPEIILYDKVQNTSQKYITSFTIESNNIDCASMKTTPFYVLCVYFKGKEDHFVVFKTDGSSLVPLKEDLLSKYYGLEPKSNNNSKGIRVVLMGDDVFLIGIYKSEGKIYVYAETARIGADGSPTKVSPPGSSNYATAQDCNSNYIFSIASLSSEKFITICKTTGTNQINFSLVRIKSDNSMTFEIDKKYYSLDNNGNFNLIAFKGTSYYGMFYDYNKSSRFIILNSPNCEDIDFSNDKTIYVNQEDTFQIKEEKYIDFLVNSGSGGDFKVLFNLEDIYSPGKNSLKIYDKNKKELPSSPVDITQTFTINAGIYPEIFTYTYTVYKNNYGYKACKLIFSVRSCNQACYSCKEFSADEGETKCNGCAKGYYKFSSSNTQCYSKDKVLKKFYSDGDGSTGIFSPCNESCLYCTKETNDNKLRCTECDKDNSYYPTIDTVNDSSGKNCLLFPATGYYLNSNDVLEPCTNACLSCSGPAVQEADGSIKNTNCDKCNVNSAYYPDKADSKQCWNELTKPVNYFLNANKKYEMCYTGCKSCTEKGTSKDQTKCTQCDVDNEYFPKETDQSVCYSKNTKPENYFFDQKNQWFSECFQGCKKCDQLGTKEDTKCIECADGYFQKEEDPGSTSKYKICYNNLTKPPNYYLTTTNVYKKCDDKCAQCELINSVDTKCTKCSTGYAFVEDVDGECWKIETDYSYIDFYVYVKSYDKFMKCNKACQKCSGVDKTNLNTECLVTSTTSGKVSNCKDSDEYYPLFDQLSQCYNKDDKVNHYYFDNNVFKSCHESCLTCNGPEEKDNSFTPEKLLTKCSKCDIDKGYYPYEKDLTQCYNENTKPTNTYIKFSQSKICDCSASCDSCQVGGDSIETGYRSKCTKCKEKFYPIANDESSCIDDEIREKFLADYFFDTSTQKYKQCSSECMECDIISTNCTKCDENFDVYLISVGDSKTCQTIEEAPTNYYLDKSIEEYYELKQCHSLCSTCEEGGTDLHPKCTTCADINSIPDSSGDCIPKTCPNLYYFDTVGAIQCLSTDECPDTVLLKYPYLQEKECIASCDPPKVIYEKTCLKKCPDFAELIENSNICFDSNKCRRKESKIMDDLETIKTSIDDYSKDYCVNYEKTDKQVLILNSIEGAFSITIFKDENCALTMGNDLIMLDLAQCPAILRTKYGIKSDVPFISAKIVIPRENSTSQIGYAFYNSLNCERLNLDYCKEEKVTINVPINKTAPGIDIDKAKELAKDGIDVYDSNDDFFNDICFEYTSENGKDITLSDRRKYYFQNVSFCQEGCEYEGVNLTSEEAICNCDIKTSFVSEILDNPITGDFMELIEAANFEVLECYKEVFTFSFFIKNIGSWFIIILMITQTVFLFLYMRNGLMQIRIYLLQYMKVNPPLKKNDDIYEIEEYEEESKEKDQSSILGNSSHSHQINNESLINNSTNRGVNLIDESPANFIINTKPAQKQPSKLMLMILNKNYINDSDQTSQGLGEKVKKNESSLLGQDKNKFDSKTDLSKINQIDINSLPPIKRNQFKKRKIKKNVRKLKPPKEKSHFGPSTEEDEELSDDELNKLELPDALVYDKRPFCEFYWGQIKEKQDIINTFINIQVLDPFPIRVIYFLFQVGLYFTMNGLFFTEEEISALYLEELDTWTLVKNEFTKTFYSYCVLVACVFFIGFLTSTRSRIEMLIKREKDENVFREESLEAVKSMRLKNLIFIILNYILMFGFWYFCSAFCNCYGNTQKTWIIGSLVTWIIIQLIPCVLCFIIAVLRYSGMKFHSEFLYTMSICLTD